MEGVSGETTQIENAHALRTGFTRGLLSPWTFFTGARLSAQDGEVYQSSNEAAQYICGVVLGGLTYAGTAVAALTGAVLGLDVSLEDATSVYGGVIGATNFFSGVAEASIRSAEHVP